MKKKEFQNLPSTDTPINAENLNEMQANIEESCVVVSSTEPTTNEKVWIDNENNIIKAKDENGDFTTIYDKSQTYSKNETYNLFRGLNDGAAYSMSSLDELKNYLVNTAPIGAYILCVQTGGSFSAAIVQKANKNYLSFILFGYSDAAKQYRYVNGTWYEINLY